MALEAGQEHLTQESIVPSSENHRLVEVQHMIVWIGGAVIYSERRHNESTGRFVVQNMLAQRGGQHIIGSLNMGIKDRMRDRERPGRIPCM